VPEVYEPFSGFPVDVFVVSGGYCDACGVFFGVETGLVFSVFQFFYS